MVASDSVRNLIVMRQEAWDYLDDLKSRSKARPIRGRGRIMEDILLDRKAKELKRKEAEKSAIA